MFLHPILLLPLWISHLALAASSDKPTNALPTIDLGYAVYQASYYDSTYDAFMFSNIRFAAPPTGKLRFGAPQPPLQDRGSIHNGTEGFVCPQAEAGYLPVAISNEPSSEDCLFLDVMVPQKVLAGGIGNVPVLFWIYGGAYSLGSKTVMGDPVNFLKHSPSPVVWVAPNYRLGNLGFLSGPSFTLSEGTLPNAGLHDQRFAMQWVQEYIHLFHGDKNTVTLMGASAGSGSILHHVTAYGGTGDTLFHRVLPMGPGVFLTGGHATAEAGYVEFEKAAGCAGKGIDCLRALSTEAIQEINRDFIAVTKAPHSGPGLVVDGDIVPDVPSYLLKQGRFHSNISILVADDLDEAFFTIDLNSTATILEALSDFFPGITNFTMSELLTLYPPASHITPYNSEIFRLKKMIGDVAFNCNRYSLSTALPHRTYNLLFTIAPYVHGSGPTNLFNDLPNSEASLSDEMRDAMRRAFMNFVVTGNPNEPDGKGIHWPLFGDEGSGLNMGGWNTTVVDAAADKSLCEWWAKSLVLS